MIRIAQGFQRVPAQASVELIGVSSGRTGNPGVPADLEPPFLGEQSAAQMLKGLDDPDTHMAVIGGDGEIIAASPGFASLGVTQPTAKALSAMAGRASTWTGETAGGDGQGLPAGRGRANQHDPALYLLFAVETVLGRLDPTDAPDLSTSAVNHTAAPTLHRSLPMRSMPLQGSKRSTKRRKRRPLTTAALPRFRPRPPKRSTPNLWLMWSRPDWRPVRRTRRSTRNWTPLRRPRSWLTRRLCQHRR
jgi:hypothetical protein